MFMKKDSHHELTRRKKKRKIRGKNFLAQKTRISLVSAYAQQHNEARIL